MRVVVIFSTETDTTQWVASEFRAAMLAARGPDRDDVIVAPFPKIDPRVVIFINRASFPQPSYHSPDDRSFCLLDGSLFKAPGFDQAACRDHSEFLFDFLSRGRESAAARLDSASSIVHWDAKAGHLTIYRDIHGLVPSYFVEIANGVIWSSSIGPLLWAGISTEVDIDAVDHYIGSGYAPAPWTFLDDVKKIPAAHLLHVGQQVSPKLHRYWFPKSLYAKQNRRQHSSGCLSDALRSSFEVRCSPNEKMGLMLSSGVDSKLLLATMRTFLNQPLQAFTFHYSEYEGECNEGKEAARAAHFFGVDHTHIEIQPSDISDDFVGLVRSYGEPISFGIHSFKLQPIRDANITSIINGQMHLRLWPHAGEALKFYKKPKIMKQLFYSMSPLLKWMSEQSRPLFMWRWYDTAGGIAYDIDNRLQFEHTLVPPEVSGYVIPERYRGAFFLDRERIAQAHKRQQALFQNILDELHYLSVDERVFFLHGCSRFPEASSFWNHAWARAHNLNVVFPLVDVDFNAFVLRNGVWNPDKRELRELYASLVPPDMGHALKFSQTIPLAHWFRGPLRGFVEDQLRPNRLRESGLFDGRAVRRELDEVLKGHQQSGWKLWFIMCVLTFQDLAARRDLTLFPDDARAVQRQ